MLECLYFFVIGAFAGWLLECGFRSISGHLDTSPGILNTPFCILYGLGTAMLSLVINRMTNNFIQLFILSMAVLTVMEYVTFVLLKKIYGVKLWDYSDMKFNINEKVCLEFSVIWGILGVIYIKLVLPILTAFFYASYGVVLAAIVYLLFGIIFVDFVYSSAKLISKKKMRFATKEK